MLNAIKSYSKAEPGSYDVVVRLILLRVQEIYIIFRVLSFSSNNNLPTYTPVTPDYSKCSRMFLLRCWLT